MSALGERFCECGHGHGRHDASGCCASDCGCQSGPVVLTVRDLREILEGLDDALPVRLEGCDCWGKLGWAQVGDGYLELMRCDRSAPDPPEDTEPAPASEDGAVTQEPWHPDADIARLYTAGGRFRPGGKP